MKSSLEDKGEDAAAHLADKQVFPMAEQHQIPAGHSS